MSTVLAGATDDRLAQLAHDGDQDALETLLRRHYDTLRAVCHRIVIDPGNADDATQNAALSIARRIRTFDGRSAVRTWMHRVAVNSSLDEIRRTRRRPRLMPVENFEVIETGTDMSRDVDNRILVNNALRSLDPDFRVVLALRHIVGLDYDEIARELDLPIGTVKSRIARGRQQLAVAIGDNETLATRTQSDTGSHQGERSGDT